MLVILSFLCLYSLELFISLSKLWFFHLKLVNFAQNLGNNRLGQSPVFIILFLLMYNPNKFPGKPQLTILLFIQQSIQQKRSLIEWNISITVFSIKFLQKCIPEWLVINFECEHGHSHLPHGDRMLTGEHFQVFQADGGDYLMEGVIDCQVVPLEVTV